MIEIPLIAFYIACSGVFMANYNEPYLWLLKKLNLYRKPMNCALCVSWWSAIIYSILLFPEYGVLPTIFVAPMSALLALIIERLVASLPNSY